MRNRLNEPPDGGYGWVVLACCAICLSNVIGLGRIPGLVFVEIIDIYNVSRTQVFLVQVLHRLFGFIFAPFIGKLFSKYDCNVILCTGSFLISLSLILTACTTAYWQILITYGCLQGLGTNFVMAASPLTVGLYFKKRRSLAMGILYTIAGVSGFVFPMLFNWLLEIYSFNGALLILGGIALHSCAFGMLVRQPTWTTKNSNTAQKEELHELTNKKQTTEHVEPHSEHDKTGDDATMSIKATISNENTLLQEPEVREEAKTKPSKIQAWLLEMRKDLRLFQDGHFLLQLFNRSCSILAFTYFWSIVPDFVEVEIQPRIPKSQVAFILSMSSIGEIGVRFVTGTVLDVFPWPKKHSFAIITVLIGLTAMAFQFVQTYTHIAIGSILFALWIGMFVVVQYVVEMELMGPHRVHMANGLTRFVVGITNVVGGMLIGYLRDSLGSYKTCLSLLGGSAILGGAIWILEPFVVKCFPLQMQQKPLRQERVK